MSVNVGWLELAVADIRAAAREALDDPTRPADQTLLPALLPPLILAARLWGSVDPARAAGAAAGLESAPLRAAARAAAMQFAPWPPAACRRVLRRAEADLGAMDARAPAAADLTADAWWQVALAAARQWPEHLDELSRLALGDGPHALWCRQAIDEAAELSALPSPPADETPDTWRRQARRALLPTARASACVWLAARGAAAEA